MYNFIARMNIIANGASTYDSTHGLVMGGRNASNSLSNVYLLEKTKDGRSFDPLPSFPEGVGSVICLEALNNGGDIFAQVQVVEEHDWYTGQNLTNTTYIFRANSSTWERQPDMPTFYDYGRKGKSIYLRIKSGVFVRLIFYSSCMRTCKI